MIELLDSKDYKANKNHKCNYCGCDILKGTTYRRSTLRFDGTLYEWKEHLECAEFASIVDFGDWADDGISPERFQDAVQQYIYEHHYDEEKEKPKDDWDEISTIEAVKRIVAECKEKNIDYMKFDW